MLKEFLKEYMRVKGYNYKEFANRCALNPGDLSSILGKKRGAPISFFKNVSMITGFSIEMLMKLDEPETILPLVSKFLKKNYVTSLIEKKYLPNSPNASNIIHFLGCINETQVTNILSNYNLRSASQTKPLDILTEIACFNKKIATMGKVKNFDYDNLKVVFANIKKIINTNGSPQDAIKELTKFGIYVINSDVEIHTSLKGLTIQRDHTFYIYISNNTNHLYEDSYWMTLAHELMHIQKNTKIKKIDHNETQIDKDALGWLIGKKIDIVDGISLFEVEDYAHALNINNIILNNYVALNTRKPSRLIKKKILWN